ncbi:MAG TPA: FAD-dependent oxidoreductase, partial [Blastococcus sp.]
MPADEFPAPPSAAPPTRERPLRIAVVGAGPAGIYAADALTRQDVVPVAVDLIDRLPTPFGLVRHGIAPDHPKMRAIRDTLHRFLDHPLVRFVGNVDVGADISLAELRRHVDAVIYTYGASLDRQLGIEGEQLAGSLAATDLVAWYTGHPDADRARVEAALAGVRSVVVVGVGNVALDVARVLSRTAQELEPTDMPQHVLDVLAAAPVEEVTVLGRRGPAQATFTTMELRELDHLADATVLVEPADLELDPASEERA